MSKCEVCGHFNPYWLPDFHDVEREYAKVEDIPFSANLPLNQVVESRGFAWKRTNKYVRRIPIEIFRARGKWGTPYKSSKYYDPSVTSERYKRRVEK